MVYDIFKVMQLIPSINTKSTNAVKVTQINYVSRNQLHNTANFEFWLELAWLGEKCEGKTLLVIDIFFTLH